MSAWWTGCRHRSSPRRFGPTTWPIAITTPTSSRPQARLCECIGVTRRFARALDIGANSGEFTRLLAPSCDQVVALDEDMQALDALYRSAAHDTAGRATVHPRQHGSPYPAYRLAPARVARLAGALRGRFDLVIALAVIHHLVVTERLPVAQWFEVLGSWCRGLLLVEFVARDDPASRRWPAATKASMKAGTWRPSCTPAAPWFTPVEHAINPHRQLVLFQRRP